MVPKLKFAYIHTGMATRNCPILSAHKSSWVHLTKTAKIVKIDKSPTWMMNLFWQNSNWIWVCNSDEQAPRLVGGKCIRTNLFGQNACYTQTCWILSEFNFFQELSYSWNLTWFFVYVLRYFCRFLWEVVNWTWPLLKTWAVPRGHPCTVHNFVFIGGYGDFIVYFVY